jgi:hypothetical protein
VLKCALLMMTIGIPHARPTMDIGALRKGKGDRASLIAFVKDYATLNADADSVTFRADSVVTEEITRIRTPRDSWARHSDPGQRADRHAFSVSAGSMQAKVSVTRVGIAFSMKHKDPAIAEPLLPQDAGSLT